MRKVNIFDFDGTVYLGDSSLDFLLFTLKTRPYLIYKIPSIIFFALLYFLHFISIEKFKTHFFSFITKIPNLKSHVNQFWQVNSPKSNQKLLEKIKHSPAYIITASPDFLIKPYFKGYKNITIIATNIDPKTGKLVGKNCHQSEKVSRLKNISSNIKINEFYSDSVKDQYLANLAASPYIVDGKNILPWSKDYFRQKEVKRISLHLGLAFFFIYLLAGIFLSYNHDFSEIYDVIFNSDPPRVIKDLSEIIAPHHRIAVHPLLIILVQPFILLIQGVVANPILAIVIFLALIGASTISILYRFIALFQTNAKVCTLICLIYGLSFSALTFNSSIDIYNISTLAILFLWYIVAKIIKKKYNRNIMLLLFLAGLFTISITVTNYIVFLIACLILLLSKKVSFKKLLLINLAIITAVIILSFFQHAVWHSPATIVETFTQSSDTESNYINFKVTLSSIKNVIKEDFLNSFISSQLTISLTEKHLHFSGTSILSIIFGIAMYMIIILFIFWHRHSDKLINLGLILSLAFYAILHTVYGNDYCFLYSLNFVLPIACLLGVNFISPTKKSFKFFTIFFTIYLIVMIISNLIHYYDLLILVDLVVSPNIFRSHFKLSQLMFIYIFLIILISLLSATILHNLKIILQPTETSSNKTKNLISIIALFICISTVFIGIQSTSHYRKFFWFDLRPISFSISQKASTILSADNFKSYQDNLATHQLDYEKYKNNFISSSNLELPNSNFYIFNQHNSHPIIYSEGVLKDLSTNTIIATYDVKDEIIIPSEKLILITLWNFDNVAIQEEDSSIHIYEGSSDGIVNITN